ncbi:MAG TPA: hypothetical protein VII94_05070 [Candidatus Saccharimonadales bacterium]
MEKQTFENPSIDKDSFEPMPNFQDLEKQRIIEFTKIVPKLDVQLQNIDINFSSNLPKSEAINSFLNTRIRTGEPIAYFVPEYYKLYDGPMKFEPYKSQAGKASRHGVIFGDLEFNKNDRIPVAVKPFQIVEGRAKTEIECLSDYFGNAVANSFNLGGLEPIGIIDDTKNNLYSLTVLQRSLDTFDNINWADFYPEFNNNLGMQELWLKAAHSIAILHSIGDSYHGDLYLRNIATNPEGQVFPIDWEYAEFSCNFSRDFEERYAERFRDLRQLVRSMSHPVNIGIGSGVGMFMEVTSEWWNVFNEIFFEEYKSWRIDLASQGHHRTRVLSETASEFNQLEIDLKNELKDIQKKYSPHLI